MVKFKIILDFMIMAVAMTHKVEYLSHLSLTVNYSDSVSGLVFDFIQH